MTDEQISQWKTERDIARAISDDRSRDIAMQKVYDHRDEMMMTCIAHQSARTKGLVSDVAQLKRDMEPVKATDREFREMKAKRSGFMLAVSAAKYVVAAGGGAVLLRLLGGS